MYKNQGTTDMSHGGLANYQHFNPSRVGLGVKSPLLVNIAMYSTQIKLVIMIVREHLLTLQHWLNFYAWIIVGQCKNSHLDFSIFNIFIQVRGSGGDPRYIFHKFFIEFS